MKRIALHLSLAAAAAVLLLAGTAHAQTASTSFQVSATVTRNCTVTAADVAFGNYDPLVANAAAALSNTASAVTVTCTKGTNFTTTLGFSANAAGTQRRMAGPAGDFLPYNVYTTAGFGTVWGDGSGGTATRGGVSTGKNASVSQVLYAQIPANQDVTEGAYGDTVQVTVNY